MGIGLWVVSSIVALFLARMAPWRRRRRWIGELLVAVVAGLACGAAATALDFGGWREPDWRAGLFVLFGALALVGVFRLTIAASSGDPS
jgi:MFS family permease